MATSRKFLVLLLIFLSVHICSNGQLLIGPSAGASYSWIAFEDKDLKDIYKVKASWGYHAGANLSFRVQKRFFLHTGFIYSQKGRIIEGLVDQMLVEKVKYSYFEIPILYTIEFKSVLGKSKEYKWYLGVGPNISYWLGGKGTLQGTELTDIRNISTLEYKIVFDKPAEDINERDLSVENPNRLQLGLNIGAGLVFAPIPNQTFMLMARYELGHSYLSKSGEGVYPVIVDHQHTLRATNQGMRFTVAYLLDTKIQQRKKGKSTIKSRKR